MQRISYLRKLQAVKKEQTLLSQSPTSLIALDLHGRITDLNALSTLMLGADLNALASVAFVSLVAPPFLSGFLIYMTLAEGRTLATLAAIGLLCTLRRRHRCHEILLRLPA